MDPHVFNEGEIYVGNHLCGASDLNDSHDYHHKVVYFRARRKA